MFTIEQHAKIHNMASMNHEVSWRSTRQILGSVFTCSRRIFWSQPTKVWRCSMPRSGKRFLQIFCRAAWIMQQKMNVSLINSWNNIALLMTRRDASYHMLSKVVGAPLLTSQSHVEGMPLFIRGAALCALWLIWANGLQLMIRIEKKESSVYSASDSNNGSLWLMSIL